MPRSIFQQNQQLVQKDGVSVASLSLKFRLVYIALLILFTYGKMHEKVRQNGL